LGHSDDKPAQFINYICNEKRIWANSRTTRASLPFTKGGGTPSAGLDSTWSPQTWCKQTQTF